MRVTMRKFEKRPGYIEVRGEGEERKGEMGEKRGEGGTAKGRGTQEEAAPGARGTRSRPNRNLARTPRPETSPGQRGEQGGSERDTI